ncbi:hypothetical protein [Aquimarina rhabdastrellae]
MKKLFLLLCIFASSLTIQAQEDWSELKEEYTKLYSLATDISKQTDKIKVSNRVISIVKLYGTVSIKQQLDRSKPKIKNHYKYSLVKADGNEIPLKKVQTEKVMNSFKMVLTRVKESLEKNHQEEIDDILNSL